MSTIKVLFTAGEHTLDQKKSALLDALAQVLYEEMKVGAKDNAMEEHNLTEDEFNRPGNENFIKQEEKNYIWNCIENYHDARGEDHQDIYQDLEIRLTRLANEEYK